MNTKVAFVIAIPLALWIGIAEAQGISCSSDDMPCIDRLFESACRVEGSSRASCSDWIREVERSPIGDTPNGRLTTATAYIALSEMGQSAEESTELREQASQIYRELAAEDPPNVQALIGLSALAGTREERVDLLERAVAVDPTYVFGLQSLATVISSSDEPEDVIRGAQYLEQAYVSANGNRKWSIAADAVLKYERAGSPNQASEFAARVRADFGLDEKVGRFTAVWALAPEVLERTLLQLCGDSAVFLFGGAPCFDGIRATVSFVENAPTTSLSIAAAEAAAEAISRAAGLGWRVQAEYPEWEDALLMWMERLTNSDEVTASIFVTQARLLAAEKEKRLAAMQNAARLAPADGEIAFGLALALFDLARWPEALQELYRARDLLPEGRRVVVNEFLQRAAEELANTTER